METVYITGHRNPDTDSIVAALAYAALKNALGDRHYQAARLGQISDETKLVLERFNAEPPKLISNVRTQVQDLAFDTPSILSPGVTLSRAWDTMQEENVFALPIANEDGTLYGIISAGDVASNDVSTVLDAHLENVPVYNILSVLEGRVLNENEQIKDTISGHISIALPTGNENLLFNDRNNIVVCGNQPEMIKRALEYHVGCVIVCQAEVDKELLKLDTETCIISTPYNAYQAVRLICHALPIGGLCKKNDLVCFHLDDYLDDVQNTVLESRYRAYPVLDENERVVGTLSRYHLLKPKRKRVILVDHNEKSQSVPGLEQAEILEIIDHHRLADIETNYPIYVRNEPVGCVNTIIAGMYQEKGLLPSAKIAGLMCSAILSDTVMFKSPTCTKRDVDVAQRLARIANISLDELGKAIFSASSGDDKPAEAILTTDYKEFCIAGHNIAVSQITTMDSENVMKRKDEFLEAMQEVKKANILDSVCLMVTDVLLEGTQFLFVGDETNICQAFDIKDTNSHCAFLPGVMSRKKQVIPTLSSLWG